MQYAFQLAAKGFNIVLISHSEKKLQTISKEITEKFNVKTKIIVYHFTKVDCYEDIAKELKSLDIGILVNNVGTIYGEPTIFSECDLQRKYLMLLQLIYFRVSGCLMQSLKVCVNENEV